jgi:hypothetical protein
MGLRTYHHLRLLTSHTFDRLLFIRIISFWRPHLRKPILAHRGLQQIRMSSDDKVMVDTYSVPASEVKTIGSSVLEISVADEKEITTNIPAAETPISIDSDGQVTGKEEGEEVQYEEVTSSPEAVNPRGYQREMLEQSLKRNVIVAMDTGSGKTQVAVMRIQHELETCAPDKVGEQRNTLLRTKN